MELEAYGAGDLWSWRPMELETYETSIGLQLHG